MTSIWLCKQQSGFCESMGNASLQGQCPATHPSWQFSKDEYDETGREAPDFEIAEAVMEAMKKFEASIYKYNKRAKKQDERNDK
ncbi:MAG: hypothetical protein K0Q99_2268 [Clostridia bacterium]|nr:hypothetical protein [Clostridia bacterium]